MNAVKPKKQMPVGSEPSQTEVKKVKPYPFSIQLLRDGQPPLRAKVHLLTDIGVIVKIAGQHIFKVGDNLNVEFDVPTTDRTIKESVKIIKTIDNYDGTANTQSALEKIYTIELHFRNLNLLGREAIHNFVKKIGQK